MSFAAGSEACKQSIDFYKQILAVDGMNGKWKKFVVLSVDGVWPVHDVLSAAGLTPHQLVSYPRASGLREISDRAPELIILDDRGKVEGTWRGALTPEQQAEVLKRLKE